MHLINDRKILIVGLGLIGGSYAHGFSRLGFEVGAVARRQETIDYALSKGLISSGYTEVTPEYVGRFDIIVFALYPQVFVDWIRQYQSYIKPGAVITDVTGVKRKIVADIQDILRPDVEFVPAHPMAGKEVYGVENSDCAIFHGANFIITPTERNTRRGVTLVREMAVLLGFKKVSEISPEAHDEMIGFLSQLTHCIAVTLMTCKESEHLADYTGDSFRDLTRIARINENMWTELFIDNKDELLTQMDLFISKFGHLRDALETENREVMKEMMRLSTKRRAVFDK